MLVRRNYYVAYETTIALLYCPPTGWRNRWREAAHGSSVHGATHFPEVYGSHCTWECYGTVGTEHRVTTSLCVCVCVCVCVCERQDKLFTRVILRYRSGRAPGRGSLVNGMRNEVQTMLAAKGGGESCYIFCPKQWQGTRIGFWWDDFLRIILNQTWKMRHMKIHFRNFKIISKQVERNVINDGTQRSN